MRMVFNVAHCYKIDFCFSKYNVCLKKISRKARSFFLQVLEHQLLGKPDLRIMKPIKAPAGASSHIRTSRKIWTTL